MFSFRNNRSRKKPGSRAVVFLNRMWRYIFHNSSERVFLKPKIADTTPPESDIYHKRRKESEDGDTVCQLRDDIDSGRTGDKVNWPDPAAAPLGTDEEAAGTPVHPETVKQARKAEQKNTRLK